MHAIVGENGAGKSTLAKILAGVVDADAGSVAIGGTAIRLHGRRSSIAAGIGYVPQALSLVGALTLVENARLYRWAPGPAGDRGKAGTRAVRAGLQAAADEVGIHVPLDVPTLGLSLAERQLGELLIAVAQGA
ncbi:MAG: ATP-binding cassette domain-containing protein, partial [Alphaproteobacteria bacterium]|nr:ATP-binding cassette domain-containing protein [Alphaproteobacteria bacterium]